MRILITGPQGSGKTTHAQILSQKLGIGIVKTGSLLRQLALEDSPKGRTVKKALEQGDLVDNQLVCQLIKEKALGKDYGLGFVADGYPRDLEQLQYFDPNYDQVFYLNLSDGQAIERMKLRGRSDDTPELMKKRLELYHQETGPVLDYYAKRGKVVRIDAIGSIEEVARRIADKIRVGNTNE